MADGMLVGNMAEGAVNFLLGTIVSALEHEASLFGGVNREFDEIKCELESMRSFLRDVERKKEKHEGMTTWAMQVREMAYKVEDIIDGYKYFIAKQHRGRFLDFFYNIIHLPENILVKRQFAIQLQEIKTKIHAISKRRNRYRLDRIEGTSSDDSGGKWQHRGESSLFIEADDIVGIEENRNQIIGWLTEEEPQRMVLSVVGMGGLGKTTLVNNAYNNQIIKRHFDCYAWISVSQSYRTDELLRSMVKEFYKTQHGAHFSDMGTMNFRQLVETIIEFLQQKRYVVVLDDVWSIEVWNSIKVALPNNNCGSRVVLTTRNKDVAFSLGDGNLVYQLEPLCRNDAWALFCKRAFWDNPNRRCPQELEAMARTMVEKCEGLPLALVAIGGLMSSKERTEWEWRNVYESLGWELSNNPILERLRSILSLSFTDLPYYLKHCFLYCSIFPEDYLIKRKRLIRLWVAEGFVEERRGMTMEEVADVYLKELICRSMLQVVKMNYFGRVKACRMHDPIRELALVTSEKERFCKVYDGLEAEHDSQVRRLSIYKSWENIPSSTCMSHLRSFCVFATNMNITSFSIHTILSRFRLLRVLDLQGIPIESVPDELVDLFNLRYLCLKETNVKELPQSLGRLKNLQTLDVRETNIKRLPSGIRKLKKLRHLLTFHYVEKDCRLFNFKYISGVQAPKGIWKLRSLQTLTCIEVNGEIAQKLENLTQLRRFSVVKVRAVDGRHLSTSIGRMQHLRYLLVMAVDEEESLQVDTLSPPPILQKLILVGNLEKLPCWFNSLRNLSFLFLGWSRMREDPLPSLQSLPNLISLYLTKVYDGQLLYFHAGWFPRLKTLSLWELTQVNCVRIAKGAMPQIQQLWMGYCEELKMLPQGIEYLTSLQQLYLENMPKEFVQRLQGDESEDLYKVQHIPSIRYGDQR